LTITKHFLRQQSLKHFWSQLSIFLLTNYNFHFIKHFLLLYQNRYNVDYKKHAKCVKCSKLEFHWTIFDVQSSKLKARRKMQIEWHELIFFIVFGFLNLFFLSDWFVGCHDLSRITAVVDCKRNVKYFFLLLSNTGRDTLFFLFVRIIQSENRYFKTKSLSDFF
jgi:hypothetical protein